jgi:hypothetical protein
MKYVYSVAYLDPINNYKLIYNLFKTSVNMV